jgi:hypothetical protein
MMGAADVDVPASPATASLASLQVPNSWLTTLAAGHSLSPSRSNATFPRLFAWVRDQS